MARSVAVGKVVYLTGVPGTGKSTTCDGILGARTDVKVFSYSEHLGRHLGVTRDQLRGQSASIVMAEIVHAVDEELVRFVVAHRPNASVVVDSHAVTYESYGYRAIPFKPAVLAGLGLDAIICLTAATETIATRVSAARDGRKTVRLDQIEHAQRLQEAVATSYAALLGVPLYVIEADGPSSDVASRVEAILTGSTRTSSEPA